MKYEVYEDLYAAAYKWIEQDIMKAELKCEMTARTELEPVEGHAFYRTHFRCNEIDDTWWFVTGRDQLLPGQEFEGQVLFSVDDDDDIESDEEGDTMESVMARYEAHVEQARRSMMALMAHL